MISRDFSPIWMREYAFDNNITIYYLNIRRTNYKSWPFFDKQSFIQIYGSWILENVSVGEKLDIEISYFEFYI